MSESETPEKEALLEAAAAEPAIGGVVSEEELPNVLEAMILASDQPLSLDRMLGVFDAESTPSKAMLRDALKVLDARYSGTALELVETASGWRLQTRQHYAPWIARLWKEKPPKFSRAMLETLALVCYRQPITRGEIEEVRGVSVSSNIVRTLIERGWIAEVGVREVPGRPTLFGTTRQFLDDLGLKSLDQLPSLPEIKDLDALDAALRELTGESAELADANEASEKSAAEESDALDVNPEANAGTAEDSESIADATPNSDNQNSEGRAQNESTK